MHCSRAYFFFFLGIREEKVSKRVKNAYCKICCLCFRAAIISWFFFKTQNPRLINESGLWWRAYGKFSFNILQEMFYKFLVETQVHRNWNAPTERLLKLQRLFLMRHRTYNMYISTTLWQPCPSKWMYLWYFMSYK